MPGIVTKLNITPILGLILFNEFWYDPILAIHQSNVYHLVLTDHQSSKFKPNMLRVTHLYSDAVGFFINTEHSKESKFLFHSSSYVSFCKR